MLKIAENNKKPKTNTNNSIDLGERGVYHKNNKLNDLTGKEWLKFTKSWKIINPPRRKPDTLLHPAKFPETLVEDFLLYFTKNNQVVFDPFLGTGTTLVTAKENNRRGIGIELNEKYSKISRLRLGESLNKTQFVITENSQNMIKLNEITEIFNKLETTYVDFVITSPPYWNMLKTSRGNVKSAKKKHFEKGGDDYYSDFKEDLGNMTDYKQYMASLVDIFRKTKKLLKNNGYLVIVLQNIRVKEGHTVPVAWELALKLSKIYSLKQEKLWLQDNKKLGPWGYPSTYVSNVHHHYCLIFQKT